MVYIFNWFIVSTISIWLFSVKRITNHLTKIKGKVDLSMVGMVDVLRDTSIQVVESIRMWERAQVIHHNIS